MSDSSQGLEILKDLRAVNKMKYHYNPKLDKDIQISQVKNDITFYVNYDDCLRIMLNLWIKMTKW